MAYCRQCGKEVVNEDSTPNFERQFCLPRAGAPSTCAKDFRRDQLRAKRAATKSRKRCSHCTQPILPRETWSQIKALAAKAGISV